MQANGYNTERGTRYVTKGNCSHKNYYSRNHTVDEIVQDDIPSGSGCPESPDLLQRLELVAVYEL